MRCIVFLFCCIQTTILPTAVRSQDLEAARKTIRTLTSEKYDGRGYVNNGDRKAAKFIASAFKEYGLQPVNGKSYMQEFSFPVNTFPGSMLLSIDNKVLLPGEDFIVHPGMPTCKGKFDIIRITKPSSSYLKETLLNKWLLIDTSAAENEMTAADLKDWLKTPSGAAGILMIAPHKLTWTVSKEQSKVPVLIVLKSKMPAAAGSIQIHIQAKFIQDHTTANVAGMIEGTQKKDSTIFITAHYDHLGRMGSATYFPGANDNASGIAMLLELAKYYSENKNTLPYSLVFIAFAGEEAGLMGSKYYTENPLLPLHKIRFLLNLDLLGTGEEGMMVVNATEFPEAFHTLDSINSNGSFLPKLGQRGKAANSDHYWFTEAGVPAFFCYTMGGISAYHDIYDRESTLPLTKFKDAFQLFSAFIKTR